MTHTEELLEIVRAFATREPLDGHQAGPYPPGCRYCLEIESAGGASGVEHRDTCPWIRARKLIAKIDGTEDSGGYPEVSGNKIIGTVRTGLFKTT